MCLVSRTALGSFSIIRTAACAPKPRLGDEFHVRKGVQARIGMRALDRARRTVTANQVERPGTFTPYGPRRSPLADCQLSKDCMALNRRVAMVATLAALNACGGGGSPAPSAASGTQPPGSSPPTGADAGTAPAQRSDARPFPAVSGPNDTRLILIDPASPTVAKTIVQSTRSVVGTYHVVAEGVVTPDYRTQTRVAARSLFFLREGSLYRLDLGGPTDPAAAVPIPTSRKLCYLLGGARTRGDGTTAGFVVIPETSSGTCNIATAPYGLLDTATGTLSIADFSFASRAPFPSGMPTQLIAIDRWYVRPAVGQTSASWFSYDGTITPLTGRGSALTAPVVDGLYLAEPGYPVRFLGLDSNQIVATSLSIPAGAEASYAGGSQGEAFLLVQGAAGGVYKLPNTGGGEPVPVYRPANPGEFAEFRIIGVTVDAVWVAARKAAEPSIRVSAFRRSDGQEFAITTIASGTSRLAGVFGGGKGGAILASGAPVEGRYRLQVVRLPDYTVTATIEKGAVIDGVVPAYDPTGLGEGSRLLIVSSSTGALSDLRSWNHATGEFLTVGSISGPDFLGSGRPYSSGLDGTFVVRSAEGVLYSGNMYREGSLAIVSE